MPGRILLITGGNGALGGAMARRFLAEQDLLWLGVHSATNHVDELVREFPGRCQTVSLDVTKPAEWADAVKLILARHGKIDVLVNNAGIHEDGLLAMMSLDAWERVVKTNLDGTFHGCQAVLPTMISQKSGRIINIASVSALLAPSGQCNYAAAKAGVVALSHSLAKEVARLGITVNVICPGYIDTEALHSMNPEEKQAALARIPMRRFGQPGEIAAAVRFLACPEASYITGSILKIDGGTV